MRSLLGQFRQIAELNDADIAGGDLNVSAYRARGQPKPSPTEEAWRTTLLIPPPDLVPKWDRLRTLVTVAASQ